MRLASALTVAVVLTGGSLAVSPAEAQGHLGGLRARTHDATGAPVRASRTNPYQRLFETRPVTPSRTMAAVQPGAAPAAPIVKCGMTMVPGDPAIDPGIAAPASARPGFTMRGVEPSLCK